MALKFGTSGVRGLVTEMTDRACMLYAAAFIELLMERGAPSEIAIAGDLRTSTPRIIGAVVAAAREHGFGVTNCGFVPTPALAEFAISRGIGSVMVTGSHIPEDRNGIKFYTPDGEITKADELAISAGVGTLSASGWGSLRCDASGQFLASESLPPVTAAAGEAYVRRFLEFFPSGALAGLKLALYEHSAVGRDLIADVLAALGAELIRVGRSDAFLPVDTEAVAEPEKLAGWVSEYGADALISTDGDSDRPLFLDNTGAIVRGDVLGVLAARSLGAKTIVLPVSCNSLAEGCGAFEHVLRTRIGSPFVISGMLEAGDALPVVGFEANGGFLTGSDIMVDGRRLAALPTRDCLLPVIACLVAAQDAKLSVAELVATLPGRFTASDLVRPFDSELGRAVVAHLGRLENAAVREELGADFAAVDSVDRTDGVRVTFVDGRVLHFRPSGNAPEFRCYSEAESADAALELLAHGLSVVQDRFLPAAERWFREMCMARNLELMDAGGPAMDVVIVSTTNLSQAEWWRKRLLRGRGQICGTDARVAVVVEDWPGGAGNGLGTLYAFERAAGYFARNDDFDLLEALETGASVAIYHTAGKGTRLAPLPAAEANNKPGVRLPGIVELPGDHAAITILEAVIRQTAVYAPARRGRLSVFWGDQVFIPTTSVAERSFAHADILACLGPMPDAQEWEKRGMSRYGLIAVDCQGHAVQVEKVSHDEATAMIADGTLSTVGGIGVSLGSFSMSAALTEGLLTEFSEELRSRSGKLDSDPHFWMPFTLGKSRYLSMMTAKGMLEAAASAHYDRMNRLKERLYCSAPSVRILGAVNVGADARWWDYGQIPKYVANTLKLVGTGAETDAMRAFFRIEESINNDPGEKAGPEVINSVLLNCSIESGRIENSVLVGVQAKHVECVQSIAVDVLCSSLSADQALVYGCMGEDITVEADQVRTEVTYPEDEVITLQTDLSRDGGEDWNERIGENAMSYAEVFARNKEIPMHLVKILRDERRAEVIKAIDPS